MPDTSIVVKSKHYAKDGALVPETSSFLLMRKKLGVFQIKLINIY